MVGLENRALRVEVLPDKGSDIVSFVHRPTGIDMLWRSPRARSPARPVLDPPLDGPGYLAQYEGGWQDCLPNGGPGAVFDDRVVPFHGELWYARWSCQTRPRPGIAEIVLRAEAPRSGLMVEKVLTLRGDAPVLEIDETVVNTRTRPVSLMWGHHPALGAPLLAPGTVIDLPEARGSTERDEQLPSSQLAFGASFAWPEAPRAAGGAIDLSVVPAPSEGRSEWACLSDLATGWYAVTNPTRGVGFGLRWDVAVFPYLWFWQVWGGEPRYEDQPPTYLCALEPWTSRPDGGLARAIANGTARTLEAGEALQTRLLAVAYDGGDRVRSIADDGTVRR